MSIKRKKLKSGKQAREYISDFFNLCTEEKWVPTVTRLANYLGMDREALANYGRADRSVEDAEEIAEAILDARSRIEALYEDMLLTRTNVGGVTFALKNNFGWADKIETSNRSSGNIEITWGAPAAAPGAVNITPQPVAVPEAPLCVEVSGTPDEQEEDDPLDSLFED